MKQIKFIKDCNFGKVGEVINTSGNAAENAVEQGVAEYTEILIEKQIEVKELPQEDEFDVVSTAFRTVLLKLWNDSDKVNEFMDKWIWSSGAENALEQAINYMKTIEKDSDYIKKYNQLHIAKRKTEAKKEELKQTSKLLGKFNPLTIYDNVIEYHKLNPFFYDKSRIFWFWNKDLFCYEIVDEVTLINSIEEQLGMNGQIFTSALLQKYHRAFESVGRKNIPKEPPKHWIQFKDKVFDIKTKQMFDVTPEYFFCNPISYEIGKTDNTPTMDKLFEAWVGIEYVKTLYEIIAYCCYTDYPIHTLFCLIGSGRNGKSRFLMLLSKLIGSNNYVATELDQLTESRFESAKMYKKLVCFMGETNFSVLEKTSIIKKLTGQDLIGGEFKGKNPFDFVNYGKLLISSNSLPSSLDTSEGFYRRWMILDFPNEFPEGRDILDTIPEIEYQNLAKKVVDILPQLIEYGKFTNQGTIKERQQKYIAASNPITHFMKDYCFIGSEHYVKYSELYTAYFDYLIKNKRRTIKKKEFYQLLAEEGIDVENTTRLNEKGRYAIGVGLISDWKDKMVEKKEIPEKTQKEEKDDKNYKNAEISTQSIRNMKQVENSDVFVVSVVKSDDVYKETLKINQKPSNFDQFPIIHLNCSKCNNLENIRMANDLMPYCKDCYEYVVKDGR